MLSCAAFLYLKVEINKNKIILEAVLNMNVETDLWAGRVYAKQVNLRSSTKKKKKLIITPQLPVLNWCLLTAAHGSISEQA